MKAIYKFKLSKKYELKEEDFEKIFNQYKNYIKNELQIFYEKKYGKGLPPFELTFNNINFKEDIDNETMNNLLNLNFSHKPEVKLLNRIIDNEKHYNEDYLIKININFE